MIWHQAAAEYWLDTQEEMARSLSRSQSARREREVNTAACWTNEMAHFFTVCTRHIGTVFHFN